MGMNTVKDHVEHEFAPVYNENSEILILGTLPSVKSRENHFYYGHPQNRFWKLLAALMDAPVPATIEEKKVFLLMYHIAVWDVIASCDIIGSSDSSISNVVPTDLSKVLMNAPIRQIYANGATAAKLYHKYQEKLTGREIITLPSTSPANAAFTMDRLIEKWKCILMKDNED